MRAGLAADSTTLGAADVTELQPGPAAEALAAGPFTEVAAGQPERYVRVITCTPRQWTGLTATHSAVRQLAPDVRAALLAELPAALAALGPAVEVELRTDLLTAIRT